MMTTSASHPCKALRLLAVVTVCLMALPCLGQSLSTTRGEFAYHDAQGTTYVSSPEHGRVELPFAKPARISDLRSLEGSWYVAALTHDGDTPKLGLARGHGAKIKALPAPAQDAASLLMQPVFVATKSDIAGLVWLAGEEHHQLEIRAARWTGNDWDATQVVSPAGAGTQIALSTAVLSDGSWLMVWAAFDGTDDEILWSRFADGSWSVPLSIAEDNAVPDITPHLFATGKGALVAWARYDGNDYRINLARFDGDAWAAPSVIGPAGSSFPAFSDHETPMLTYLRATPRAWGIMELDTSGKLLRDTAIEVSDAVRPRIARANDEGVVLEWQAFAYQKVSAPLAWTSR